MNFRERLQTVLKRGHPDQVPFMCFDSLMPRGEVELMLRERGMGLCLRQPVVWCEYPHVDQEVRSEGDITTIVYHTPRGDLKARQRRHLGYLRDDVSCLLDPLINGPADYEAALFMADDAIYHVNANAYTDTYLEIGADGIVRSEGPAAPYDASCELLGYHYGMVNPCQALLNWVYHQEHYTTQFDELLAALERQADRWLEAAIASPAPFISLGRLDGQYGPRRWKEHVLPFYQRAVPRLRAAGKVCALHAHAPNLAIYKDLVAATGVDVVEAVTPPPGGDLSLAEARAAWGPKTVIWVNIPDAVLWYGAEQVRRYVLDLLHSDQPGSPLILGLTETGLAAAFDQESENAFRSALLAVAQAIEEHAQTTA